MPTPRDWWKMLWSMMHPKDWRNFLQLELNPMDRRWKHLLPLVEVAVAEGPAEHLGFLIQWWDCRSPNLISHRMALVLVSPQP